MRYGGNRFGYLDSITSAEIGFELNGKLIRYRITMPDPNSDEFTKTPSRRNARSIEQVRTAWEQAYRQRWRALSLIIKAKLEFIESGMTTLEEEFLAQLVLPDGNSVGDVLTRQVESFYLKDGMPKLLMGSGR